MPTTVNLKGGGLQLGMAFVVSIIYRAFASVTDQSVEVPIGSARYVTLQQFSARNAGGTDLGTASIALGNQTVLEWSHTTTLDDAVQAIFPPPGTVT